MVEWIRNIITQTCWKIIQLNARQIQFETSKLPDLCPTPNAENVEYYIDRLNDLLSNRPLVREIAITAPYSGGKSSFIQTYKHLNHQYKYTSISLAAFKDKATTEVNNSSENIESSEEEHNLRHIEKSIVQQILYRAKSSQMPNSRFRRIVTKPLSGLMLYTQATLLVFGVLSFLYITDFSFTIPSPKSLINAPSPDYYKIGALIYIVGLTIWLLQALLKTLNGLGVSKFNPMKGEVAFEQKKNDSVFNIYLEELIYYFHVTKSNVVIFEDLDRFERLEIFVKLKELNKLLNDSNEIDSKTNPIRFIYALKDDVFTSNNRTKFFDAIIPIIPITNTSNSFPILKKLLSETNLIVDLTDEFLRDVSVYLDDMRMLKNIVAEYGIYKPTLERNLDSIEAQKLFSFIIYKNVYSNDFAALNGGDGKLAFIFSSIGLFRKKYASDIDEQLKLLKETLSESRREQLLNIKELNSVFLWKLIVGLPHSSVAIIHGHTLSNLTEPNAFDELYSTTENLQYNADGRRHSTSESFRVFGLKFFPTYPNRKKAINNKTNNARIKVGQDIEIAEAKLNHIGKMSIKQLCKTSVKELILKEIKTEKLLCHLIEKGYLNEMYHTYISLFIEGSLTKLDMDYVMSVKNQNPLDPTTSLKNCSEILDFITDDEYRDIAFLNYNMINFLIEENISAPLKACIDELSLVEVDSRLSVLLESINFVSNKMKWFASVNNSDPNVFSDIVNALHLTDENKKRLIVELISAIQSNDNDYFENYKNDLLCDYLVNHGEILTLSNHSDKEKEEFFKAMNLFRVKFHDISEYANNITAVEYISTYELFEVNRDNLKCLMSILNEALVKDSIAIEQIINSSSSAFVQAVEGQIDNVVQLLLVDMFLVIESEQSAIWLLNNPDLSSTNKAKIIESNEFVLEKVDSIEDIQLIAKLIKNERIGLNWKNLWYILSLSDISNDKDFGESLSTKFLNIPSVYSNLSTTKSELTEAESDNLCPLLIRPELELETFKMLHTFALDNIIQADYQQIGEEKLRYLIDKGHIKFEDGALEKINSFNDSLLVNLIEVKYVDFQKQSECEHITFNEEELVFLLGSKKLTQAQKHDVINRASEVISATLELMKNIEMFASFSISKINEYVIDKTIVLLPQQLRNCLLKSKLNIESRVRLFIGQIQFLDTLEIKDCLSTIGPPYSSLNTTGSYRNLEDTDVNVLLAKALKHHKIIKSWGKKSYILEPDKIRLNMYRK